MDVDERAIRRRRILSQLAELAELRRDPNTEPDEYRLAIELSIDLQAQLAQVDAGGLGDVDDQGAR